MYKKTYLALSDTKQTKKQGWVRGDMQKARRGAWKLLRSCRNPAITKFHNRSLAPNLRLFLLQPLTGKTHQLRVAMKSLASPILGDTLYGGKTAECLFLHTWQLQFHYQNQLYCVRADLPDNWPQIVSDYLTTL